MAKYISIDQLREAFGGLSTIHPFFGTTFVVLKQNEVPIGTTKFLSLDAENKQFLQQHFRLHPKSSHFFLPFKIRKGDSRWKKPKYASATLQAINTQAFAPALIHEKGEPDWGWSTNYVDFLESQLPRGRKVSLFDLAVWLYREEPWNDGASRMDLIQRLSHELHLSDNELDRLFSIQFDSLLSEEEAFQPLPANPFELIGDYGLPEDVPPEAGATLRSLEFSNLGPARHLKLEPGSRLNIITGDNGLGKTFLLDVVWWALTQEWADQKIVPLTLSATPPQIKFAAGNGPISPTPVTASFSAKTNTWKVPSTSAVSGLVLYARVDGSFAVWDPANLGQGGRSGTSNFSGVSFSRDDIWNGDKEGRIEGLLRDWVRWQTRQDEFPAFETFKKVVERTRPPDLGDFSIGEPRRLPGWGAREIPTLVHPYGRVPIVYESAGIRRILALAYLIVWAWEEHKIQAKSRGLKEERQMVIILDEAEAHLHPRWQRALIPALVGIAQDLHEELAIQYFIASHSPMVLASAEPVWDDDKDSLHHLSLNRHGRVEFVALPFELRGTADSWLQSPSFDGLHPGSEPAEKALDEAKLLMEQEKVSVEEIDRATANLASFLAPEDPFWLRWVLFAKRHGATI
ncbi:MAG: AAA family ATPase [Luteolibacter sp.]